MPYDPARYEDVLAGLRADHGRLESRGHHDCRNEPCRTAWLIAFLEANPPKKAKR